MINYITKSWDFLQRKKDRTYVNETYPLTMKLFQPQWNFSYHSETNSTAKVSLWFLQMENWGGLSPPIRTFAELIMTQWNFSIMPKGQKPYTTTPFWYRKSTMVSYQNHRANMVREKRLELSRLWLDTGTSSLPVYLFQHSRVSTASAIISCLWKKSTVNLRILEIIGYR